MSCVVDGQGKKVSRKIFLWCWCCWHKKVARADAAVAKQHFPLKLLYVRVVFIYKPNSQHGILQESCLSEKVDHTSHPLCSSSPLPASGHWTMNLSTTSLSNLAVKDKDLTLAKDSTYINRGEGREKN